MLSDVSLQLFIADSHGMVQASSRPAIIGTDVGNRDYFRHEASLAADDDKMFVGELTRARSPGSGRLTWSVDWTIRTAHSPA